MIKILFICHGNICRSTMAESVMTYLVKQRHMEHQFRIASAATSREEIGNGPTTVPSANFVPWGFLSFRTGPYK